MDAGGDDAEEADLAVALADDRGRVRVGGLQRDAVSGAAPEAHHELPAGERDDGRSVGRLQAPVRAAIYRAVLTLSKEK